MLFSLGTFSAISLFILQVVHAIASNTFGKVSAHFEYELYFLLNKVPTRHYAINMYSKIGLTNDLKSGTIASLYLNVMCDHACCFICIFDSLIYMLFKF